MKGKLYSGINNIYRIRDASGNFHECRIKGKILQHGEQTRNPLAPGDEVDFEVLEPGKGQITARLNRRSEFSRWNKKSGSWQVVAANLDILVAVASLGSPPFRPRFIDRVLVAAAWNDVPVIILVNKMDKGTKPGETERMAAWEALGIPVLRSSAKTGQGMEELKAAITGKISTFFGQSGAGKSTMINCLVPGHNLPTGEISQKHNRGRHVTNFGRLIDIDANKPDGGQIIDTPGIRDILVRDIDQENLPAYFPEITANGQNCAFQPCSHTHEVNCAVQNAVETGTINKDRYESYVRILRELKNGSS